jgi:hypothetical protein
MIRRISVRNVVAGTLAAMAASALFLAPQAAADPGDETSSLNEFGVELATDECNAAWIQVTVNGGPQRPDMYSIFYKGMEPSCTVRARFVGKAADGVTPLTTDYVTTNGAGEGAFAVPEAYRCHVEFGVQRSNGTYHTERLRPLKPEIQNCP